MMEYSEQFMEHIEYTFAAFCNVVLFHSFPFRRLCCCTLPQREVIRERIGRE